MRLASVVYGTNFAETQHAEEARAALQNGMFF